MGIVLVPLGRNRGNHRFTPETFGKTLTFGKP